MFHVLEMVRHNPGGQLGPAIAGVLCMAAGFPLLIWPRKSNEKWWMITQALRPWRVRRFPLGLTIAVGCLMEVIALVAFYGTWVSFQN